MSEHLSAGTNVAEVLYRVLADQLSNSSHSVRLATAEGAAEITVTADGADDRETLLVAVVCDRDDGTCSKDALMETYRAGGCPEIWLLHSHALTVHIARRRPSEMGGGYDEMEYRAADLIAPLYLPGVEVDLHRVFGQS